MKPNTLATFYEACAPAPDSTAGVLPPPDLGPGAGHFNVFPLADLRGAPPMNFNRRDYYKITLCRSPSQVECADQPPHTGPNTLFLVTPQVPYRWLPLTAEPAGYCCVFDDAFLLPARSGVVLAELPLFQAGAYPVWEVPAADCAALEAVFEKMARELPSAYAFRPELLRTYLWELIYLVQKLQPAPARLAPHRAPARLAAQFAELLERQFTGLDSPKPLPRLRTATDYARQLAVHVNHLNRVLKETTGHTTTALLSRRLVQQAQQLLRQTDWPIAAIADQLGFADAAHFATFFKRHAGHPPGHLRRTGTA